MSLAPDEIVAGHRVVRCLGEGGYGAVYEAVDLALERTVALKILKTGGKHAPPVARFWDEAKVLARMDDPRVVRIYQFGELPDGDAFISMELFGTSLPDHLTPGVPAPLEYAIHVILEVLAGLAAAHAANVIHRDIKEANILVGPDGRTIKLCDFGIARADDDQDRTKTLTGLLTGTPKYIAPERMGRGGHDARSDIFSVGVVFYRLLTGQHPFESAEGGAHAIMAKIATEDVPPPSGVPRAVARVCARMLARKADARYQSAEAAAHALRAAAEADPTGTLSPVNWRRPRGRGFAIGAAVGLGGALLAIAFLRAPDAPDVLPDAHVQPAVQTAVQAQDATVMPDAAPDATPEPDQTVDADPDAAPDAELDAAKKVVKKKRPRPPAKHAKASPSKEPSRTPTRGDGPVFVTPKP